MEMPKKSTIVDKECKKKKTKIALNKNVASHFLSCTLFVQCCILILVHVT